MTNGSYGSGTLPKTLGKSLLLVGVKQGTEERRHWEKKVKYLAEKTWTATAVVTSNVVNPDPVGSVSFTGSDSHPWRANPEQNGADPTQHC
jgi:hypothetical protein